MDAMNEALLKPTEYPAADKTYDHPMWFKGTEPEQIKHASTYKCSDCGHQQKGNVSCEKCGNACSFEKTAEIEQHNEPRVLPPRNELRSHLDDEVKKEIQQEKEGKLAAPKSIQLTPEQDQFWQDSFEFYADMGYSEVKAVRMADRETVSKWPELAKYRHWTDPNSATGPTA